MTAAHEPKQPPRVGVAIATRERRAELEAALERLLALPERPPVVVADNGSRDGTPAAIRARFPAVEVLELGENRGAGARNAAVRALDTPYVPFSDDDSWWGPGALDRAAAHFDRNSRLGLLPPPLLVGSDERLDPVCAVMAHSPLRAGDDRPGRPVLGFVACGAIVRRDAFLSAGGFDARYGIGGEGRPFAVDLAPARRGVRHLPRAGAHPHPAGGAMRPGRRAVALRNDVWSAWLHRPAGAALRRTAGLLRRSGPHRDTAAGLAQALRGAGWVARERRVVPPDVERALEAVERSQPS